MNVLLLLLYPLRKIYIGTMYRIYIDIINYLFLFIAFFFCSVIFIQSVLLWWLFLLVVAVLRWYLVRSAVNALYLSVWTLKSRAYFFSRDKDQDQD